MIRLVVFDLDGTLVDSADQIVRAMRAGYAAAGRRSPEARAILSIVGMSLPQAVERLSPDCNRGERETIVAAYRDAFVADAAVPQLYPGAMETLEALSARSDIKLAVATGKTRRGLVKVLDQHRLAEMFHSLHGGDEYPSKPDPAMLRGAMAAAGVSPEETIMVGDSLFDIEMAAAAGVDAIAVAWGYGAPADLVAAGAVRLIDDLRELRGLVLEAAPL